MRGHNHVFAAVLLGLGWLLAAPGLAASSLAEVKARGKLIVLCFPHQESPFIRVRAEVGLGHYDGVDYEVMEGFARSLAVALEVRPVKPSFNALLPALLRGDGDVIASEFSVTEERRKQVDFSVPYFTVHHLVVVPAGSAVRTPADLAGKRASTIVGSSNEEQTRALRPGSISYADFTRWSFDALNEGKADFTVQDEPSVWRLLKLYPNLKVALQLPGAEYYSYAVVPKSDLKPALDRYIEKLRRSGKLDEIIHRYLGQDAATTARPLPSSATHPPRG
ncbi:MAG TPA: transporter substrate-binding domain-containing protein [Thermoanaerobaculia bacterium]|nr:transporter substrate-binding domain-containing protein [Thermoanaerobaculia bacterium]